MGKFLDLKGQKFGRLYVESFAEIKNRKTYWNCTCECGNKVVVRTDQLRRKQTQSCGCYNVDSHKMKFKDLTEKKFGYWTVLRKEENGKNGAYWRCRCICGKENVIKGTALMSGQTLSCGCYNREKSHENAIHGMSRTRMYRIYQGMKERCYNPKNCKYHLYGGKGIRICDEWLGEKGFINFSRWAYENGYNETLTIDRYPNKDGNYEPSNCRWATALEQANNINTNLLITWHNETHTISEWSRMMGINKSTLHYRFVNGWGEERLFSPPQNKRRKK